MTLQELLEDHKYLLGVVGTARDSGHARGSLSRVERLICEHPETRGASQLIEAVNRLMISIEFHGGNLHNKLDGVQETREALRMIETNNVIPFNRSKT